MDSFYLKYLKYKNKYLKLKNLLGGANNPDQLIQLTQNTINQFRRINNNLRFNVRYATADHRLILVQPRVNNQYRLTQPTTGEIREITDLHLSISSIDSNDIHFTFIDRNVKFHYYYYHYNGTFTRRTEDNGIVIRGLMRHSTNLDNNTNNISINTDELVRIYNEHEFMLHTTGFYYIMIKLVLIINGQLPINDFMNMIGENDEGSSDAIRDELNRFVQPPPDNQVHTELNNQLRQLDPERAAARQAEFARRRAEQQAALEVLQTEAQIQPAPGMDL